MNSQPVKLLDRVGHKIRLKHYFIRTEKAYISWIRRYIYFHNKRHPKDMGRAEIEAFLTDLALNGNISASTLDMDSPPVRGSKCFDLKLQA